MRTIKEQLAVLKKQVQAIQTHEHRKDERLEALVMSFELTANLQQDTHREIKRTHQDVQRFVRFARAIILDHEARLENLEGNNGDGT